MTLLRRLLQVLLIVATLVVGAAAVAIVVSQTAWFRDWLRGFIVQQANQYLNGTLSIGSLGGNLFFGLELEDVGLVVDGERVVSVRNAGIDYSAIQLVSGNLVIDHVRLDQPVVVLRRDEQGWNLARVVKRQEREQERTGPGRALTIGEVGISDGTVRVQTAGPVGTSGAAEEAIPSVIDRLNVSLGFEYEPVHYTARIGHISFRSRNPDIALNSLSGTVAQRDDDLHLEEIAIRTAESSLRVDGRIVNYLDEPVVELVASSDKLDIPEIARAVPALEGIELQPAFRVDANGPLSRLGVDFSLRSSAGNTSGRLTANATGPERRVAGVVNLEALNLAPILQSADMKSHLTGRAEIDFTLPAEAGRGPIVGTFTARMDRAQVAEYAATDVRARGRIDQGMRVRVAEATARAYGARATLAGLIVPGSKEQGTELTMDLRGRVAGLDLRRLPRHLNIPPAATELHLDYRLAGTTDALRGSADLRESRLAGATLLDGTTASFSLDKGVAAYGADGSIANLDLRQVAQAFEIEALNAPRFESDLNGRFSVKGRGTKVATLTLDATAWLENSTLSAARVPAMQVEAHLDGGAGRFVANGEVADLDPAALTGRQDLAGKVSGRVNVNASVEDLSAPITPESVNGSAQVALDSSSVGDLTFERAVVNGQFANGTADLQEVVIEGDALDLKANGTLALGAEGASNLQYHLDARDLAAIGRVVGQPLQGSLSLDGKVTGNRADLQTGGEFAATNVGYGDTKALSAEGSYQAQVPNFDVAAARASTDMRAMFVAVAGEELTRLEAKASYANKQVEFNADAQQTQRQARVGGRLVLHPDHREVHLADFGFTTQGTQWTLAPGNEPAVQYGGEGIAITGVNLVSGPQRILVEGTIGKNDSQLRAELTDVDVSTLDSWIVGERNLGGVLNASARVTGPQDNLRVEGEFGLTKGSVEEFEYESLAGTATYADRRVVLDARLQQGPTTWMVAKGTVPLALFQSPGEKGGTVEGADDPVDFQLQSSSVDLGLVQGFTNMVEQVTGTLEADVRATGTAAAPRLDGFVSVSRGAFDVAASGVSYSDLNGRIAFAGDRAVIENLSVMDEHQERLTMSGEVAAQGKGIGELQATVSGKDFEVLHNDLGRIAVETALRIGGRLQALRIDGDITLNTAGIEIDEFIEEQAGSYYATTPTQPVMSDPEDPAAAGSPARATAPGAVNAPASARPGTQAGAVQPVAQPGAPAGAGQAVAQPGAPAQEAPEEEPAPGPFEAAQVNVRLRIPDVLIVRGDDIRPPGSTTPIGLGDVNITLGGDLRLQKEAGEELEIVGDIRTVRGTYDFQGRRFQLQRDGRVMFQGISPIDPALDLTATRVITGVEARVHIGGTARKPELTLSSQPQLDESDILSLIVFGQPANQLGAGEQVSLAQRASAIATGFVASKLADSLGEALDLDIFEIEAAPEGVASGAAVTVGEQVGERLFLRLRQGVGGDTTRQFIMEYRLLDFLRLETTMSQGGNATRSLMRRVEGTGLDLIFFFNY